MIINKVISYKGAWKSFCENNDKELENLLEAIPELLDISQDRGSLNRISERDKWRKILENRGWEKANNFITTNMGSKLYLRNLGPIKNGISASLFWGTPSSLHSWLFQQSVLACKLSLIEFPVMLVNTEEFNNRFTTFEMVFNELEPLAPLSHPFPFLILGYSGQLSLFETQEIYELESDELAIGDNIIIDRSLEFPSEYYQAGIGILSFFGTYIRENYPDQDAKVRIEQNGKIVRLIIETVNGKVDVIEKALEEYQLIISGQAPPEKFTQKDELILELKNELRIAKYRIESQNDIIQLQDKRIDQFLELVKDGLNNKSPITIDFRPVVTSISSVTVNQDISLALSNINELKELLPSSSSAQAVLKELEASLEAVEKEKDPDIVKKSSAMSKFRRFIEKVSEGNDDMAKAIKAAENGWEVFKDLAGKYNKIAEWCGLPQVPSFFTKK